MKQNLHVKIIRTVFAMAAIALILSNSLPVIGQILTNVEPDQGMQGQTLQLTVSGQNTNFMQATSLSVRLQQGTSTLIYPGTVEWNSNLSLNATFGFTFVHDPGNYDMRVFDEIDGEMILENAFEIIENPNQPELLSVEPDVAEKGQTLDLLVSGQFTHFQASTTTVWLNQGTVTIYPNNIQTLNNSELLANFTFNFFYPDGLYDVNTYNNVDGQLVLDDSFTLLPGLVPTITEMQPASAMRGTMLEFDIYGQYTHFAEAVYISTYLIGTGGGSFGLECQVIDNEHLHGSIIIPYAVLNGNYNLHVLNNIDGELVMQNAFMVLNNPIEPYIVSIEPDTAYVGDAITVETIANYTWFNWTETFSVWMTKTGSTQIINSESVQVIDNQKLEVDFNIPPFGTPGYYDYHVYDDIDGEMIGAGLFYVGDSITGISDPLSLADVRLYPNPTTGQFYISADVNGKFDVTIFNPTGLSKEFRNVPMLANQPLRFSIDNFADGFYFVKIVSDEKTLIKKLIKQ